MIFTYKAIKNTGEEVQGTLEAFNVDIAINQLQKQGLIISQIHGPEEGKLNLMSFSIFNRVSHKDIVVLSRQMATLFQAQVSALRVFRLLGEGLENRLLKKYLFKIADDIQSGSSISTSLAQFPDAFSDFYVNMVKAGEESGKLDETFNYLADYLDRTYEVTSKAKNAFIYTGFVMATFLGVMLLMFTVIIPKIALMITDSGQAIPIYTKIVLFISNSLLHYGLYMTVVAVILGYLLWKYARTEEGATTIDRITLDIPYLGDLYHKLYLSRIADNINTMIGSGIPILRALEITSSVVDNRIYKGILDDTLTEVKAGASLSSAFGKYKEIPSIMVQMIKVGEETGEVGSILKTLSKFYQREVVNSVDTMVGLIEPIMIVTLGLGVGVLLAAVLMPIYNIASSA